MDESKCYRCTLDVQRISRDPIVVHEMFNGFVEMVSLYMICLTDESRCYRCIRDVQRISRDTIVCMRSSTDESRCYPCTRDVQRMSRDAIVALKMFNRFPEMLSLSKFNERISGNIGVIGFILCSTDGPPVDFKIPINPIEKVEGALEHRRELKFYNSQMHGAAFALPSFVKREVNFL
uniref:Spermine synthase n=1 Tax=Tanacetum cinerariifolium TaxID=118510 RepID=A0A6L2NDL7_TANCI|nr:spermine synthase [Tanacetum cinerariifolium]